VTIQLPTQVTSCCNLLAPVVFKQSKCKDVFFTSTTSVHCHTLPVILLFNLTCQNYFRDTFADSPVPNKSTVTCLMNCFHHCRNSLLGCIKHEEKHEYMYRWMWWIFPTLNITLFFVFWFQCNLFFYKQNMCQEWVAWLFDHSVLMKIESVFSNL
jgi:hypothetical protein